MFKHILVPVDLSAKEQWAKAITIAGEMARHHGSRMTLVSVGGTISGSLPHSIGEQGQMLAAYAAQVAQSEGVDVESRMYDAHDPDVDVDRKLIAAIDDTGADLIVMATHQPGWIEYLVNSHAGRVASHAPVSVFVVRD